jgi:catechol 2,3-dioxygenase-like lactoylglutathione lyase family enzyme
MRLSAICEKLERKHLASPPKQKAARNVMVTTAGDIDSVNHVGVAVRDLTKAAEVYEALGFTLSPLSVHSGSTKPGQPPEPLATGNRCAIFPNNYIEVLGIVNPGKPDWSWGSFLERFQGGHIICFGCKDANVVYERLAAKDLGISNVVLLQRDIELPEGIRTAKFDCVHFDRKFSPEGMLQAARHRNPEYVHQPRYLTHRNGAQSLAEVVLSAMDPEAVARRYEALTGQMAQKVNDRWTIDLPLVARLIFMTPEALGKFLPGGLFSPPPSIAAMGFKVANLQTTADLLAKGGFTTTRVDGKVIVPAEEALGVTHYFI